MNYFVDIHSLHRRRQTNKHLVLLSSIVQRVQRVFPTIRRVEPDEVLRIVQGSRKADNYPYLPVKWNSDQFRFVRLHFDRQ